MSACQPEGDGRDWFHSNLQGTVGEEKNVSGQIAGSTDICRVGGEERICVKVEKEPIRNWKECRQNDW